MKYKHGTNMGYTHGKCRCGECRAAHANANFKRNRKIQNKLKKLGYRLRWILVQSNAVNVITGTNPNKFVRYFL